MNVVICHLCCFIMSHLQPLTSVTAAYKQQQKEMTQPPVKAPLKSVTRPH